MDRNQGNYGGRMGSQSTTDSRGLGNMDNDDVQQRIAQQRGEQNPEQPDRQEPNEPGGQGGSQSGEHGGQDKQGGDSGR